MLRAMRSARALRWVTLVGLVAVEAGARGPAPGPAAFASLGGLQLNARRAASRSTRPPTPRPPRCAAAGGAGQAAGVEDRVRGATLRWIKDVVVGLNLCPWANSALVTGAIRVVVSTARDEEALLEECVREVKAISELPPVPNATTVIAISDPSLLKDFVIDYIPFTVQVDDAIDDLDLRGVVQLATFHPDYQFQHTQPGDPENWTNRAPYPMLHLLREKEISDALDKFGDPDKVWRRNEKLMRVKGAETMKDLIASCVPHDESSSADEDPEQRKKGPGA